MQHGTNAVSVVEAPQGPKTGRRAANRNFRPVPAASEVASSDLTPSPVPPPPAPSVPRPQGPRRQAGWNEAAVSSAATTSDTATEALQSLSPVASPDQSIQLTGVSRRKAAQIAAQTEDSAPEPTIQQAPAEDVDMIMDIPNLEAEEDISRQVAAAPAVRGVSRVDIAELESADLFRLPVVDKDHQVDLSLLTACLCPADQVAEELVEWDYNMLLTEIASELNAEKLELQPHEIANSA